jgi:hypothetical protein
VQMHPTAKEQTLFQYVRNHHGERAAARLGILEAHTGGGGQAGHHGWVSGWCRLAWAPNCAAAWRVAALLMPAKRRRDRAPSLP